MNLQPVCGGTMDMHDLWNDDPESLFLELGFGCDEPDLSARIPARFINFQSQANGMSLQVFLEAQRNRVDLENPDVSCRFRQVEVFQQVTTAFLRAPQRSNLSPEALARKRHISALFRRLARKSLSEMHDRNTQDTTLPTAASPPVSSPPSSPLSKIHPEELMPYHEEMIDSGSVATGQTVLKTPGEVLTNVQSSVGVLILHDCPPHTLSSSSIHSSSPTADVKAPLASPPPSLEELLSFDRPPSPHYHLSSPDGNYLEIPALMSEDSSPSTSDTSSSVTLVGSETENPQSPSDYPHLSDLDAASPKVTDSASSLHPTTSFPALPEMSFPSNPPSGNVSASESKVKCGASQGKPTCAVGCQESTWPHSATYVAYYSISSFHYPSHPVVPPLNEAILKESAENSAEEFLFDNIDSRPPSTPVVDQSEVDLPDDITNSLKDSDIQVDLKQEEDGVSHNNVTETADLNTKISDRPSEAPTVISEEKRQLLTVGDKQSIPNARLREFGKTCVCSSSVSSDCDLVQRSHDSPDATTPQTPSRIWDLAEESSCDPDPDTWLDGPAAEGEALLSAVLDQVDTEGVAYWAEPIRVSVSSPVEETAPADPEHLTSHPDVSSHSPLPQFEENNATLFPGTPSSFILDSLTLPSAKPSPIFSSCSLPSSLSSHIAHRKDVPLTTRSTSAVLSSLFALDTSTPFRAVQSWTQLQIQRLAATGGAHNTARRPHVRANRREDGDCVKAWRRRRQIAPAASVCGHQCNQERVSEKQERPLAELQEMTRCLRNYYSVFSSMEEHLCEEQAESYQLLSEQDRRNLLDIEALRQAVKKEAGSLQTQLDELVCHYDESLKQKMQRLLDEQSHSLSQLRVSVAETLSHTPSRSVGTQCCLLPRRHGGDGHAISPESCRRRTPESHYLDETALNGSSRDRLCLAE